MARSKRLAFSVLGLCLCFGSGESSYRFTNKDQRSKAKAKAKGPSPIHEVDHIGIATHQLDDGLAVWQDALGLKIDSTEEITEQGVRVAVGNCETHIELLEALTPDSPWKVSVEAGPGIHHIAVEVDDIVISG